MLSTGEPFGPEMPVVDAEDVGDMIGYGKGSSRRQERPKAAGKRHEVLRWWEGSVRNSQGQFLGCSFVGGKCSGTPLQSRKTRDARTLRGELGAYVAQ